MPVWVGLSNPDTGALSRTAVEEMGDCFGRTPVGTRPFRAVSRAADKGIRFERNENVGAIAELAKIAAVKFLHCPEGSTRLAAFETGEINALFHSNAVPVNAAKRLKDTADAVARERPSERVCTLMFNVLMAPLDTPEVRHAICHTVDTGPIIALGIDGHAVPAVPPLAA